MDKPKSRDSKPRSSGPRDSKPQGSRQRDSRPNGRSGRPNDRSDKRVSRPDQRRQKPDGTRVHEDGVRDWDDGLGEIDLNVLPREVQEDLKSLKTGIRAKVERYLAAARLAIEEDPDKAYEYAVEAGKLGGRSPVVREAVGICAYNVGDFKQARLELQAAVRMGGRSDLLPVIADCERALDRPDKAIELLTSQEAQELEGEAEAERLLVLAGARGDSGQTAAALATLKPAADQVKKDEPWAARIVYGYADALLASGDIEAARDQFMRCAGLDEFGLTDATDRLDELDGQQQDAAE